MASVDPISSSDRILALLRIRLSEQAKTRSTRGGATAASNRKSGAMATVRSLSEIEGVDAHQIRRQFLQEVLAEQLGSDLVQDAKFQTVVDNVLDALSRDEGTNALLNRVVMDLAVQRS
jgi:hypothetical protein